MIIGYVRVLTAAAAAQDQNLDLQTDELTKLGCQKIYQEKVSSGKERPQLMKMIENLRKGDSVMVWKLDRLARSLKELINLVETFRVKQVNFTSIKDSIDTYTVQGRLLLNIFG